MDFRRFAVPVVVSLVVGGVVYGLSLAGQQSLRAEIEQIKQMKGEADRRFADVDALVSRLESIDHRVSSVEKTLPASAAAPAEEPAPAAAPAPAVAAPAEPAAPAPAPAAAPAPDKP